MSFNLGSIGSLVGLIPQVFKVLPVIKETLATGLSFNTIGKLLESTPLHDFFSSIGGALFPEVRPELQSSAAIATSFAPEYVKKVQNSLNVLVRPNPPLDVDGHYGKMTQKATKAYQETHDLVADGWAGDKTMAQMAVDLAKVDDAKKVPKPAAPIVVDTVGAVKQK